MHLEGRPGRLVVGEELPVDGVHLGELADVLHQHRRLDHVLEAPAGRRQDGAQVCQRLWRFIKTS